MLSAIDLCISRIARRMLYLLEQISEANSTFNLLFCVLVFEIVCQPLLQLISSIIRERNDRMKMKEENVE